MGKLVNLIGQRFDKLIVLDRDYNYNKNHNLKSKAPYWICQCDCGNITTVRADSLIQGKTTSCGCFRKQQSKKSSMKRLKGQFFGSIEVLEDLLEESNKQGRAMHLCKCHSCGNLFKTNTSQLLYRGIISCGCLKSKGEQLIGSILTNLNIKFIKEYKINGLVSKNNILLRFDFYLPDYNMMIEYQGIQHYDKKSNYYSDEMVNNDQLKRNYCVQHNIKLVEISYKDFNNLNCDYIKNLL